MTCLLCSSMQPHQYSLMIRKWLHPLSKSQSYKINLQKILSTSFSGWRITSCHRLDNRGTSIKNERFGRTLCITIQNESIYRAPFVKPLGLFMDEILDWGDHVSHILKKVSSGLSILKMSKNYLPQETLKILYNSLIETHFRYGNIIWGNCWETFLTRLQKLQNWAARIITGSDYDTPAEPLIEQLGWKTVRKWIENDTSVMMYKSMNNMAPTYLSDLFTCSSQFHSRDLRGSKVNL